MRNKNRVRVSGKHAKEHGQRATEAPDDGSRSGMEHRLAFVQTLGGAITFAATGIDQCP